MPNPYLFAIATGPLTYFLLQQIKLTELSFSNKPSRASAQQVVSDSRNGPCHRPTGRPTFPSFVPAAAQPRPLPCATVCLNPFSLANHLICACLILIIDHLKSC